MTNKLLLTQTDAAFTDDTTSLLIAYLKNNWDYPELSLTLNTDTISLAAGLGQIHGYKYPSLPIGQVNGISLDVKVAAGNIRIKMYSDAAGIPTTLLAESSPIAIGGTGIQRFNFDTPYVNGTISDIWFMYEYDDIATEFGGASSGTETYQTHVFSAGPQTWVTSGTLSQTTWMTIFYQPLFAVLKSRCDFTNKPDRADAANVIYLQRMTTIPEENSLGMSRIRYHDFFYIQISAKGDAAIKNRFLIEQHIEDLINGNPKAERSDGFDEFKITKWMAINTAADDDITKSIVNTQNSQLSRSKAVIDAMYEKYPISM